MTCKMFFAGFGGQGVLMMGQLLAYAAMKEGKEVTFMPSYGPEMRGGTANCTVIVSDKPISCPVVNAADVVVAMNGPSLERYGKLTDKEKWLFVNSSLAEAKAPRSDIKMVSVAANELASETGNERSANLVMLGAILKETGVLSQESVDAALEKSFSKKPKLIPGNLQALHLLQQ